MDSDYQIHAIFAITAIAIVLTISGCINVMNNSDNATMKAMVVAGADPIKARCAVKYVDGNQAVVCAAAAAKP